MFNDIYDNIKERTSVPLSQYTDDDLLSLYFDVKEGVLYYRGLEQSTKKSANSLYGYHGSKYGVYSNVVLASDITKEAECGIKTTHRIINDYYVKAFAYDTELFDRLAAKFPDVKFNFDTNTILSYIKGDVGGDVAQYSDTDSTYINAFKFTKALGLPFAFNEKRGLHKMLAIIKEIDSFRFEQLYTSEFTKYANLRNMLDGLLIFETELIAISSIFVAKKKYIMAIAEQDGVNIIDEGYMKTMGIELARSATSLKGKQAIRKLCNILLMPNNIDEIDYLKLIQSTKQSFIDLGDEIYEVLSQNVNLKSYNDYIIRHGKGEYEILKKANAQNKASVAYNKFLDDNNLCAKYPYLEHGMLCSWYYVKGGGSFAYNPEYGLPEGHPEMDIDLQFEKIILKPLSRLSHDVMDGDIDLSKANKKHITLKDRSGRI